MTIFDYLLLIILICSMVIGLMRGLIKEMLSLISWVAAFVAANAYGAALAALLPQFIPGGVVRLIAAFIILFIGTRLLMQLLIMAIHAVIKAAGLSAADRGMGGMFGLGRGLVIVLSAVLLCGMTSIPQQAFWKEALFSSTAETAANMVKPFLPGSIAQRVQF